MEQELSVVSLSFIHIFSGIRDICSGFKPLETFPFLSSSSQIYSYVISSTFGRVGSWLSALLSSIALYKSLSSSACALFVPSILFIMTCIIISLSLCLCSCYYSCIASYIYCIVSLVSSAGYSRPALFWSAYLSLCLFSSFFESFALSSSSIILALKSKFFLRRLVISLCWDSILLSFSWITYT